MTESTQALAPPVAALSFEQTVPCSVAHRRALGEVFVADSAAGPDGDVFLALQLPRAHTLWFDRTTPFHDTFSVAEAARQGSFVALHRHLGVPVGLPFTLQRFEFAVADLECYRDSGTAPLEGILRYTVADRADRGTDFSEMRLRGEVTVGGRPAMTIDADVVFLARDDYAALRRFQLSRKPAGEPFTPPPPFPPELVGRLDRRNVVVGDSPVASEGGEARFAFVVDRTHPSFFDHDYDHVPGPFIVEGFRQAALVTAVRTGAAASPLMAVTGCATRFTNFGEFDSLLECTADVGEVTAEGAVTVEVGLHQFGKRLAEGRVELTPLPER
ncbi:hypothetical protein LG943_17340 [Streptomonospora sp. S1-112]|uniref:A-factor biosynthesis hotdog domain-containing protein n=1 Tax=Streptomonospora mangrovi TaxID=2883123 RepID=A0A9X3NN88_9ACTN|nr:AfsA-related hotdog domain-containing protein [Streptomonospora mangrovi]MDA0566065.1 hypothetical protein [Streptomonospora mangrovi]